MENTGALCVRAVRLCVRTYMRAYKYVRISMCLYECWTVPPKHFPPDIFPFRFGHHADTALTVLQLFHSDDGNANYYYHYFIPRVV